MKTLLVFTFLILASCASERNYLIQMHNWKGKTEDQLVSAWGAPSGSHSLSNGGKVLTYNRSGDTTVTLTGLSTDSCITNFTISKDGIITVTNYKGSDCRATTSEVN